MAVAEGNWEMANEFCTSINLMSPKAQLYSQAACKLLQQRGHVVVVSHANDGTATAALNELHLETRTFRGVLLKFKAMRAALWTR